MQVFEELQARGLVAQTTGQEEIEALVNEGKAVFYIGFDPTADSLTVGHFVSLTLMRHLQMAGNRPIALIGGGTTMVGDPSGRTDLRVMMTPEKIAENADKFRAQMERFIDFSPGGAIMVNNADWLLGLNYVSFLRDIGVHFSVNRMLSFECYKSRMEKGLTFLEFNYMLMQSYDFLELYNRYGCTMQCGGDDQWANILSGTELIRRKLGKDAHAFTTPLLLTSDGVKMGKTQKGALWLDPEKTTPYEFYQYFRNVADSDAIGFLKMLTFVPLEEIKEMEHREGAQLNAVKERLALELTARVHGEAEAVKARDAAKALFATGGSLENVPSTVLTADDFVQGDMPVTDLMVRCKLAPSKSEARRLIGQGGVEVDGQKVEDVSRAVSLEMAQKGFMIKKGKKIYHKISFGA